MRLRHLLPLVVPALLQAQVADSAARARECPPCAGWNAPRAPFRLHGNTWYVGTEGLTALLITSGSGHVLLDAGLPESAPRIMANVRALGFRVEDVKLIVNSHAHYDHAGGIAELQRASGARVAALPFSAEVIRSGKSDPRDPQRDDWLDYPGVDSVETIRAGQVLRVGPIALTAHHTGGHTPGGTSWSWRSCEGSRCAEVVYADSQTPISSDSFYFTRDTLYRTGVQDFERGFATLERLTCDVLVTPHPSASQLFERHASGTLVDAGACKRYAASARSRLRQRIEKEKGGE